MASPLVSVIIPLYNSEKYISETIESVLNQTYQNIEIIIIDDGSTDNSLREAKTFEQKKINIYSHNNKGVSSARNLGINKAKGEYIQFLDADDLLHPKKIELQVERIIKSNISPSFICSNWARIAEKSTIDNLIIENNYIPKVDYEITTYIKGDNFIPLMSGLVNREIALRINGFDEKMTHIEDVNLLIRLFKENNNFLYLESEVSLFYYRNVPSSASNQNFEAFYKGVYTNCKLISKLFNIKQNSILFEVYWNIFLATSQIKSTDLTHKAILELKKFDRPFSLSKKYGKTYLISKLIGLYLTSKILYLKYK